MSFSTSLLHIFQIIPPLPTKLQLPLLSRCIKQLQCTSPSLSRSPAQPSMDCSPSPALPRTPPHSPALAPGGNIDSRAVRASRERPYALQYIGSLTPRPGRCGRGGPEKASRALRRCHRSSSLSNCTYACKAVHRHMHTYKRERERERERERAVARGRRAPFFSLFPRRAYVPGTLLTGAARDNVAQQPRPI